MSWRNLCNSDEFALVLCSPKKCRAHRRMRNRKRVRLKRWRGCNARPQHRTIAKQTNAMQRRRRSSSTRRDRESRVCSRERFIRTFDWALRKPSSKCNSRVQTLFISLWVFMSILISNRNCCALVFCEIEFSYWHVLPLFRFLPRRPKNINRFLCMNSSSVCHIDLWQNGCRINERRQETKWKFS